MSSWTAEGRAPVKLESDSDSPVFVDFIDQSKENFPAKNAFSIVPNDSASLSVVPRAIYISGGGKIVVDMYQSGSSITFDSIPDGTILPIRVSKVYSTGTTASGIVGLY